MARASACYLWEMLLGEMHLFSQVEGPSLQIDKSSLIFIGLSPLGRLQPPQKVLEGQQGISILGGS